MAQIAFPTSTAPGLTATEGAGRLINAYAEKLQPGGPAPHVIRRAPGTAQMCETSQSEFRGMWYDGSNNVYVAYTDKLYRFDSEGSETSVGDLYGGRLSFISSYEDVTSQTAYTYSAVPIGPAQTNRRIVVAVFFDDSGDYPATMTIGGVAATSLANASSRIQAFIAVVPTGTTADVVVTYATGATSSAIAVWKLDGASSSSAFDTASDSGTAAVQNLNLQVAVPTGGSMIWAVDKLASSGAYAGTEVTSTVFQHFDLLVEDPGDGFSGGGRNVGAAQVVALTATVNASAGGFAQGIAVSFSAATGSSDYVTFAKNNAATPDQVVVSPIAGAYTFTTSAVTPLSVNSDNVNSVTFGEGYFFFSTPEGLVYASGINVTTVNALDVARMEARAERLLRVIYHPIGGELFAFGETHIEVWASNGNPNVAGFPFNRTTVIGRGLVAPLAVTGFEEGFEGGLFWVADDNSVRMLQGYQAVTISTPALERAIEGCADKSAIKMFCYDIQGHACVVVDIAQEWTWVYDISEGGLWHERRSDGLLYWRATGNSVKAFGKWLAGDYLSGDILEISADVYEDVGNTIPYIVESIAMEDFPRKLRVPRAEFNFISGIEDTTDNGAEVLVRWSDNGGSSYKDQIACKLADAGEYRERVRLNRLGQTSTRGRRWRLRVDDPVYVGLLGGSMDVGPE